VTLHRNSKIVNTNVSITNNSIVELEEGAIINSPVLPLSSLSVDNGSLILGRRAHLMSCEVLVRFGGKMTIGSYSGIAYGSELRCEERLDIGSYAMISYGVCIYDTNTHSLDWRERRARIEHCYPEGVWEDAKPVTSPVVIGDDVWIGKEVTITKGARIGNRCIIGIRSIIGSGVVEDDSIVVAPKSRIINRRSENTSSLNQDE
jgi:acetyltransferase-like isoleucine patch superfamily enzyme